MIRTFNPVTRPAQALRHGIGPPNVHITTSGGYDIPNVAVAAARKRTSHARLDVACVGSACLSEWVQSYGAFGAAVALIMEGKPVRCIWIAAWLLAGALLPAQAQT